MKYFIDTEFIEDGKTIDLISIGIVSEDGREFYAEVNGNDFDHANDWVKANVLPYLWSRKPDKTAYNLWSRDGGKGGLLYKGEISREIKEFVSSDPAPEFWGYYADYDWVVFCQLWGTMMDLPRGFPMFCRDFRQALDFVGRSDVSQPDDMPHHALSDARWIRDTYGKYFTDVINRKEPQGWFPTTVYGDVID